jgi:thioredoxin-related protein
MIKKIGVKYEGFENALKKAKKEHKIIMIKIMSKDCHFCKKMDREVFVEKEIVEALEKDFVSVSIDVATTKLPLGLKTKMTPNFVFVDVDSKVLMDMPGAWDKMDFLSVLRDAKRARAKREDKTQENKK